jgi:hypothetical protein
MTYSLYLDQLLIKRANKALYEWMIKRLYHPESKFLEKIKNEALEALESEV